MTAAAEMLASAPTAETVPPWEELMRQIADFALDELQRGAAEADRKLTACRIAVRLCNELGGTRFYWPRGDGMKRAARDMEIAAVFDGTANGPHGVHALARRYGVSDAHLWRILAKERERGRKSRNSPA